MKHHFNYLLLCNKSPLSGLNQKQSFRYFLLFLWIRDLGGLSWTARAWIVVGHWPEQLRVARQLSVHADAGPLPELSVGAAESFLPTWPPRPPKTRAPRGSFFALTPTISSSPIAFICYKGVTGPSIFKERGNKLFLLDEKMPRF